MRKISPFERPPSSETCCVPSWLRPSYETVVPSGIGAGVVRPVTTLEVTFESDSLILMVQKKKKKGTMIMRFKKSTEKRPIFNYSPIKRTEDAFFGTWTRNPRLFDEAAIFVEEILPSPTDSIEANVSKAIGRKRRRHFWMIECVIGVTIRSKRPFEIVCMCV